ncbi:I78 family peptidase inhibitor [Sphingomonas xanthus]|uniref:Peptidase inhibitor I78 n=1 Tax=Sphingomonas xanthus TaxID=2594473 RepID=A0A516ITP5_9SPHN|nr:I78 family peptidase inhibitor [Sphingomonas xanthus]QDP20272.1 peptidase inhibitor I78 [Sphingomonas xanthus]
MRILFATLSIAALAGCTVAGSDPVNGPPPPGQQCRNDQLGQFSGQTATQELGARMLAVSGARIIRWVPQGGVVTMDYRMDRLTVQLDGANRVVTARCG